MKIDRSTVVLVLVVAFVVYWFSGSSSPFTPKPDRPVVRWIARAARALLWVSLVAEDPPEEHQPDHRLVQTPPVGEDGYPRVDNARGW